MIRFAENLNKMIAAGLGGALDPPRTEVAVGHRVIYTEVSGAVVNFESNVIAPLKNLRVTMEPIQDLHGQDAPYPAGGGKNLLEVTATSQTINGVTFTVHDDGTVTANGTAMVTSFFELIASSISFTESTILNGCPSDGGGNTYAIQLNGNTPLEVGSGITIAANTTITSVRIRVASGATLNNVLFRPMIRLASVSDSAFAPYSNICPISGREIVTVWREASYNPSADSALTIQLGDTVYGGTLDVSTGRLTVTHGEIASYNGEVLTGEWISDRDVYAAGTAPTIGAQVVYVLDTPQTIDLDPQQITTLIGDNNVWSDVGNISLEYPYYEETEGY